MHTEKTIRHTSDDISKIVYYLCLGISVFFLITLLLLRQIGMEFTDLFPYPCIIRKMFGICCPGCGLTRALTAFLHGQFLKSFLYHPLVILAILFDLLIIGSHILSFLTAGNVPVMPFHLYDLYLFALIIGIQWMIKICLSFS